MSFIADRLSREVLLTFYTWPWTVNISYSSHKQLLESKTVTIIDDLRVVYKTQKEENF